MPFELLPVEEACADIRAAGGKVLIRPSSRARGQLTLCGSAVLLFAGFAIVLAAVGVWPISVPFAIAALLYVLAFWRIAVAGVTLNETHLVSNNMWSRSRVGRSQIASVAVEAKPHTSLWTYGMDARWPMSWQDILVVELRTSDGRTVKPEALRSVDEGRDSSAVVKANLVDRWRRAHSADPADPLGRIT